jgi:cyclopropane fatty-acyl-phospholipid synthase-like methyltransferase
MIEQFFDYIAEKDKLAFKQVSLEILELTQEERYSLEDTINFFAKNSIDCERQADAYLFFRRDSFEHQLFLMKNDRYKYATYEDVASTVYDNDTYMTNYMCGLAISQELFYNHRTLWRWLKDQMRICRGKTYLEVGPGHGRMFDFAIENLQFDEYTAIDISQSSLDWTARYVNRANKQTSKQANATR